MLPIEHITDSAASDAEKGAPCHAVEKAAYKHRLDVLGHSTWDYEKQEDREGGKVDVPSPIELTRALANYPQQRMSNNKPPTMVLRATAQFLHHSSQY